MRRSIIVWAVEKVMTALQMTDVNWYEWSDSQIVLAWIKSTSKQWRILVRNRVVQICDSRNRKLVLRQHKGESCRSHLPKLWCRSPQWVMEERTKLVASLGTINGSRPMKNSASYALWFTAQRLHQFFGKLLEQSRTCYRLCVAFCPHSSEHIKKWNKISDNWRNR